MKDNFSNRGSPHGSRRTPAVRLRQRGR